MMTAALLAVAAVLLDWLIGEPRNRHPLIYFGRLADIVERNLYGSDDEKPAGKKLRGLFAVILLIVPFTAIAMMLSGLPYLAWFLIILMLYFSIGHKSLHDHAQPVITALQNQDMVLARCLAGRMVSRDTESMDPVAATVESVLENGNDAVFAALFWFAVAGAPGAILYRLVNTLDAMWGYRSKHYRDFGWAAARFDDVLNYLPARLTALTYALLGKTQQALFCWRTQASAWDSPNAGPVMAAGAGALGISIGGAACYRGEWRHRPLLGVAAKAEASDIKRALKLVRYGVYLWLGLFIVAGMAYA